ncbi:efflux RND transporter periplasmic adaptor subunit [Pelovirga terrestris]|uniref:Efflux RND transporter periplasmic adaptor subunit n=1 Tax=Pelovirga terrestris TaxID=2771352 RepID=A0A8J6QM20_9BACT|nr:efflux RND transporter periplasmic adaptor subunit [Pelovirga terrestris]MBD1399742.1 efflux RND transporter periplasmic adaptor subunit [Pelovirga terrestris]
MKRIIRFLLPLLILSGGIAISAALIASGPEATRQRPQIPPPTVEVITLKPQSYQVQVASRGTVSPRTESTLVAETAGRVVKVADNFYTGGFFEQGDLLLQVDDRDYQNAVIIARAEVAQRQLALAEEQARSDQARRDWQQFQQQNPPPPLVVRTPQLENAAAALAAAQARMRQAELNLERTRILAPYAGRILTKDVDIGQYITTGTRLARIYASDALEVRLPLSDEQLSHLTLPEEFRNRPVVPATRQAGVTFSVRIGSDIFTWSGRLVRTEGSIDINSRQLFVIARIDNPYQQTADRPQLKIGQFVEARISGSQLEAVYRIPRQAIHGERTVHIITPENRLERRELDIVWRDTNYLVASGPLRPGEQIALTRLPFAADGISVRITNNNQDGRKGQNQ